MAQDAWDPEQYGRFAAERTQPFLDLLALLHPIPSGRAVDLGCGTGELTRALHERLGAAETLGIDSSAAMLARAKTFARHGLRFEAGDLAAFAPERAFDVVFSNAALHWVPDHPRLLERLAAAVAPAGQIAFQVPANFDHPSHTAAEETAREEPFADALGGAPHPRHVLAPEAYAALLDRLGFAEQTVRLQVYGHRLASREEVIEWVKGTLLTDYEKRLPAELFARFLARYREKLFARLPDERPFFFPFKRILVRASR
ncbi:MAG TPA: methyltransferase domain-containing protein [Thermoanaerobaculia bacterium]|nr:methyltransferase domain-containing protein [Thermoanaerobaculia bacterium]